MWSRWKWLSRMVARRISRDIRSLPRERKPVPQSRMIVCSPAITSTQLVLPPNRIWVDEGQGIVPRTPQKVAVNAMANRCWLKGRTKDYHRPDNTIVTLIPTFDTLPKHCRSRSALESGRRHRFFHHGGVDEQRGKEAEDVKCRSLVPSGKGA